MTRVGVGLIGSGNMGKAYTHAFTDLPIFFDLKGVEVVKEVICSRGIHGDTEEIAKKWGWNRWTNDWREVIEDNKVHLVVIAVPNRYHAEIAIAAARTGKHILCEKPLARDVEEATKMVEAVERAGVVNMVAFNYRRVPAILLAKQLIEENRLGEMFHFRACWQQSWLCDPTYPSTWRTRRDEAGYGTHGDLGSHLVDIARFLVGEIAEVLCFQETFVDERPLQGEVCERVKVDVDDASAMIVRFHGRKTIGYIEVTRYGMGHRNQNRIEINGSKGAIVFDMEDMNNLYFYDATDPNHVQGFRKVQVGEKVHPYMGSWWSAGHIIGYGETFIHQVYDLIQAIAKGKPIEPSFHDGLVCQKILEAGYKSFLSRQWVGVKWRELPLSIKVAKRERLRKQT